MNAKLGRIETGLRAALDAEGYGYVRFDQTRVYELVLYAPGSRHLLRLWADEAEDRLILMDLVPWYCPEERRAEVAELLCRLNFGLLHGSWAMDFADGDVGFQAVLDLRAAPDATLETLVDLHIRQSVGSVDQTLPWLYRVITGACSADEAAAARRDGRQDEADVSEPQPSEEGSHVRPVRPERPERDEP
jgi:hypothetical protein